MTSAQSVASMHIDDGSNDEHLLEELQSLLRERDGKIWMSKEQSNDATIRIVATSLLEIQKELVQGKDTAMFFWGKALDKSEAAHFVNTNDAQALAKLYEDIRSLFQRQGQDSSNRERAKVTITHAITGSTLSHSFDIQSLSDRVLDVFGEFYPDSNVTSNVHETFCGPYFPFIQSSGMGKTKILFEYRRYINSNTTDPANASKPDFAKFILCRSQKAQEEGDVFDGFLDLQIDKNATFEKNKCTVFETLDKLLPQESESATRGVLMFDEVHYLLDEGTYKASDGNGEKTMAAMLFRLIRLWLCKKRSHTQLVAIFAGTTAKIKNFIIGDDLAAELKSDSRQESSSEDFYARGKNTFPPFFTTTTIGCLQSRPNALEQGTNITKSDHTAAVVYGRPLFATLTPDKYQSFLPEVLGRMVSRSGSVTWTEDSNVWMNILATRAQIGQTSFERASKLVASSYAVLVGVSAMDEGPNGTGICIAYLPDPVCARLAMCMMDERWEMNTANGIKVRGQCKHWWVKKMKELYSEQICSPEKGNFGEVMVALYCLFCADAIRGNLDGAYNTFSVPLEEWIDQLVCQAGAASEKPTATSKQPTAKKQKAEAKTEQVLSFGAIQVCRNYVRSYNTSWASIMRQGFLANMYKSGVGYYAFAGCEIIDLVFSLRLGSDKYLPLLMSVKSHVYFAPGNAEKECQRMADKVAEATKGVAESQQFGALCILVVFGSGSDSNDGELKLDKSCTAQLKSGNVVSKVLRISMEDKFGFSEAFRELTTAETEESELLASHSVISSHCKDEVPSQNFLDSVVRLRPKNAGGAGRRKDWLTKKLELLASELCKTHKGNQQKPG